MSIVAFVYKLLWFPFQITSSLYSNVTTSTRINSTKCTYIHLCLFHSKHIQYSTWCQNRGCICIASTRRTYRSNPAVSCIHPSILIILQILHDRIFLQRRGERSKERYFSVFEYSVLYRISSVFTCNPRSLQWSHGEETILHIELIPLQEFFKKYYNYKAHPVHTDTRHPPATVPHASKHSTWQNKTPGSLQYTQASSNSTRRNSILSGRQHLHTPYKIPQEHFYRILQGEIGFFPKGLSIANPCSTRVSVFQFTNSCA